jgi:hypothetical protein
VKVERIWDGHFLGGERKMGLKFRVGERKKDLKRSHSKAYAIFLVYTKISFHSSKRFNS